MEREKVLPANVQAYSKSTLKKGKNNINEYTP